MRFAVDRPGSVTELKYWRGSGDANDTDVREGHLWRADGTLLATVTFTSSRGPGRLAGCHPVVARHPGGGSAVYRLLPHQRQLRGDAATISSMRTTSPSTVSTTILSGATAESCASCRTASAAPTASSPTAAARRSCRRSRTMVPTTGSTSPSTPTARRQNSAPVITSAPALTSPENRRGRRHGHRDRRRQRPSELCDRRRRRRRALHHQCPDRPAELRHRPELRGPGRRGRQQRLRRDRQRQRRHRAAP